MTFIIGGEFKPYKVYGANSFKKKSKRKRNRTRLYFILKEKDWSQMDLAEEADLELAQVSLLVNGLQKDILMNTAKRICNALKMTLDEVFSDQPYQIKPNFDDDDEE